MQIYFICDIVQKEDGGQFNTKIDFQLKSYASERNQLDFIFIVNFELLDIKMTFPLGLNFTGFFCEGLPIYMFSLFFLKFWTIFGAF